MIKIKDFGDWEYIKNRNAIVSDKPTCEHSKDKRNLDYYGGYLVCESVWNKDIVKLIKNAPKLLEAAKDCVELIRQNDTVPNVLWMARRLQSVINEIEGDKD